MSGHGCKGMFSSPITAGTSGLTDWGFWSSILGYTITTTVSASLAHFKLWPSLPLTCRMAPYRRSSTSRGSSPTLGRWFGSEHRKSRLLRPPLQIHTGQAQQKVSRIGETHPSPYSRKDLTKPPGRSQPPPSTGVCRPGLGSAPSPSPLPRVALTASK